ncbi:hypothetical protein [Streptomyces sp. NRRL S-1868]|uniref:hypothetical protein n=1 Tax=Streptomyces sp. NRRL S-1868 TaxID=1463892 RepID=UPI0004C809A3|nr:hypothetical protein [Streptomyces sp. NRRL S-1868]
MSTPSPLAHRSVLPVPHTSGLLDTVRARSLAWLRSKYPGRDLPLGTGQHQLDDISLLTSQAAYDDSGTEYATRLQLRQDQPEATWRTTITAVRPPTDRGYVCVDLECFAAGADQPRTGRPRLVRDLVAELTAYDGLSRLSVNALRVTRGQVDSLIDVLCDPDRRLPVVVAARPVRSDPLWSQRVSSAMQQIAGDASSYLLWDLDTVDAFRAAVGEDHRVAPGVVRTYLPGVDPAWAPDAGRHRWLARPRWTDPADQAWRGVVRRVHTLALEQLLPQPLVSVRFPDLSERHRQERRASMDRAQAMAAVPAQRTSEREDELRAEVALLNGLLAQADKELAEATRTCELADRTATSLREQLQVVRTERDDEMEDHLITLNSLERVQGEADRLRAALQQQGRWQELAEATAQPAPGSGGIPDSFEELWQRLDELPHLTVTAEPTIALDLDEHAMARTWSAKAWSALHSLNSYAAAAAEGYRGGYYQFCQTPPPGGKPLSVKLVAMTESESVMAQYGDERLFPVPGGGRTAMQAHIKLGYRGRICPRLYFLDDVKGDDGPTAGRLVVGYIGPHLTNTRTS